MKFNRIWILGGTAAGKSTLAKRISEKLKIPCCSTDEFIYKKKWTEKYSEKERNQNLKNAARKTRWVIEGFHTGEWVVPSMEKADVIVFLHISKIRTFPRVIKRQITRKREGKPGSGILDCVKLLWWNVESSSKKYKKHNREGVNFITLKTPRQVEEFLEALR